MMPRVYAAQEVHIYRPRKARMPSSQLPHPSSQRCLPFSSLVCGSAHSEPPCRCPHVLQHPSSSFRPSRATPTARLVRLKIHEVRTFHSLHYDISSVAAFRGQVLLTRAPKLEKTNHGLIERQEWTAIRPKQTFPKMDRACDMAKKLGMYHWERNNVTFLPETVKGLPLQGLNSDFISKLDIFHPN